MLLLTALVRGLATTLLLDIGDGRPPPDVPTRRLHAAHRLAARNGLAGEGLDPARGECVPAVTLAERLLARAAPWLAAAGDLEFVEELFHRVRCSGGGAARQRAAYLRRGAWPTW